MIRDTVFISGVSYRPAATASTRLDMILSSAEAALARAEDRLRRTQRAWTRHELPHVFNSDILARYPQETGQR